MMLWVLLEPRPPPDGFGDIPMSHMMTDSLILLLLKCFQLNFDNKKETLNKNNND
jgi:hypothetical protein